MRWALVAVLVSCWPELALGFTSGAQFDADALSNDGSGGVSFTGAPRLAGRSCAVCHTGAPKRIGIRLEVDQLDLFEVGYDPGATYHVRVEMVGEWAGLDGGDAGTCGDAVAYLPCNDNGFALEIDDAAGVPVGGFAPTRGGRCAAQGPDDFHVYVLADGTAVTHAGAASGQSYWDLCWTAPDAGTGPLVVYVTAVDGNGGDGTAAFPNDLAGDDTFQGALPLVERGGQPAPAQRGGCAAVRGVSPACDLAVLMLLLLARRSRCHCALLLALSLGCGTVRPWQREHMAKRIMKFGADPDERELDQHMLEAREGSSGGYGSSGGGCGCN